MKKRRNIYLVLCLTELTLSACSGSMDYKTAKSIFKDYTQKVKAAKSCEEFGSLYEQWYDWWWDFDINNMSKSETDKLDKMEKDFEALTDELEIKLCRDADAPTDGDRGASQSYLDAKSTFAAYTEKAEAATSCDELDRIYDQWLDWWWKYDTDRMSNAEENDLDAKEKEFEALTDQLEKRLCNEDDDESSSMPATTNNWDKVLDSYEAYVNKYVACMKKLAAGDVSVMSEYANLLEKAEELGEQLENASSSMTTKQMQRYTKINAKMLEAAASGF